MRAARGVRRSTAALGLAAGLVLAPLALTVPEPAVAAPMSVAAAASAGTSANAEPARQARAARKASAPRSHRTLANWRRSKGWGFGKIVRSDWNVRDRTYSSNEDSYLLARNTTTRDGKLLIRAKREQAHGRRYTSGYVDTNNRFSLPNYFRVEVRAKVPMEQGMWAAPLWFRPADFSGGEIDLVETYGRDRRNPIIHQTIHTDYGDRHQKKGNNFDFAGVGDRTGTRWHRYVVRKLPGKIVMSVDGVRTAVFRSGDPGWFDRYYETGKRWHLRANLQVGGDWGGRPDSTTDWSGDRTTMKIDYIHTWTRR